MEAGTTQPLPGGHYKTGVMFAGTVSMIPRLENRIAYLLEGAIGDISTVATDETIDQHIAGAGSNAGVNVHQFLYYRDATGTGTNWQLPYFTVHKFLPANTTAEEVGEISMDACFSMFQLNVGAGGIVTANVGLIGRGFSGTMWDLNPGWTAPTLDAIDTYMAASCTGFVKISISGGTPGTLTTQDVTGLRMTFINNLLPPNNARKIGSPYHIDHPNLSRGVIIEMPQLVSDYDTYMQIFGGAADPVADTGWSCSPLEANIDIELQSPEAISGAATTAYYTFRFRTTQNNVRLAADPVALVANQPVVLNLRSDIARVASGVPFEMYVQNDQVSYA